MENLFDTKKSRELRDIGIRQSFEHAEQEFENWGNMAYNFLLDYAEDNNQFMAEDVRVASLGTVPTPPSNRAWGAVFVLAKRNNLIKRIGYSEVKNPKAHKTPATLWEVN